MSRVQRLSVTAPGWLLTALAMPLLWWGALPHGGAELPARYASVASTLVAFATLLSCLLLFHTGYRGVSARRRQGLYVLALGFGLAGMLDLYRLVSAAQPLLGASPGNSAAAEHWFWLLARLLVSAAGLVYVLLPQQAPAPPGPAGVLRPVTAGLAWLLLASAMGLGLAWPVQTLPLQALPWLQHLLAWLIGCASLATLAWLWLRSQDATPGQADDLRSWGVLAFLAALFGLLPNAASNASVELLGDIYRVCAYLYLYRHICRDGSALAQHQTLGSLRDNVLLSAVPDGILVINAQGQILMLNPEMEKLSGYRERELLGKSVDLLVPQAWRSSHPNAMQQFFTGPRTRSPDALDFRLSRRDGSELPVDISVGHMLMDGAPHAIAYVRDLSEMKQARDTLRHSTTHDKLTGLPNRWLFNQRLGEALQEAEQQNRCVAVMLIDLDNFKAVNDGFGHSTGDALLRQIAERIRDSLELGDLLARLGGDEFAILLKNLSDPAAAEGAAARILKALERPYQLKEQEVHSGGSLGIACYPRDAKDSDDLLRCADIAMYRAKHTGRGAYACYSAAMRGEALENLALHTRLKAALREGGLSLQFQPQVSVHNGAIVGAEALLRWDDPKLGPIAPARFIPVAEATGLILPLSDWVLDEACRTMAQWQQAGMRLPIAVNFSAHQFFQPNLFEKVRDALRRHGVPANMLDIEITETAAMNHPENTRSQINALSAIGCHVTLDDFGTGYSSLAYLKDFPVSKLKIDKSFMDGIPGGKQDITICKAIMAMARNLNIRLVAEGVEHPEQLQFLRQNGCDMYQGWLFAKAMGSAQLLELHSSSSTQPAPPLPGNETPAQAATVPDHAALGHLQRYPQALDLSGALRRMGGNETICRRAVQAFGDSLELLLPALNDARGTGNRQLGSMLIHSYKGNAATVGLQQFAKYMAHLEAALATENWQYILESKYNELKTWILATQSELTRALVILADRQQRQQASATTEPASHGMDTLQALQRLKALLDASDLSALQLHAQMRPALQGLPQAQLQQLDDALHSLNLQHALEICNDLLAQPATV